MYNLMEMTTTLLCLCWVPCPRLLLLSLMGQSFNFPPLPVVKRNRIISKHLCNVSLTLDQGCLCLLMWLIYQSDIDNRVEYSDLLIRRFALAVKYSVEEYGGKGPPCSRPTVRKNFNKLVDLGYLIKDGEYFIINKELTYKK